MLVYQHWYAWKKFGGAGNMVVSQVFGHSNCRLTKPLQLKRDRAVLASYERKDSGYGLKIYQGFEDDGVSTIRCVVASTIFDSEATKL